MSLRGVGIDVTDVRRITGLVERHGSRFTRRWFTPRERTECGVCESTARAFAIRFAAKEAVWKSLRIDWDGPVPWRSIAILSADLEPTVELGGDVAAAARASGVSAIRISVSVHGHRAVAIAISEQAGRDQLTDH